MCVCVCLHVFLTCNSLLNSSSFVIEFADDSPSHLRSSAVEPEGCFNHTFLMNRDDLSTSTGSESTEGKEDERRG